MPELQGDARWVVRPYHGFRNNISYMQGYIPPGWPRAVDQADGDEGITSRAFSGATLRTTARYLPWLYQELPLGAPLHGALLRWAELIDDRLANPELLMLAGAVDLSRQEDPNALAAAFDELRAELGGDGHRYTSPDDRPVAPGVDRGDLVITWPHDLPNGAFVAFRPARLADEAALAAMSRELGFSEAFERHGGACTCGLRFGQWDPLDISELEELLIWRSLGIKAIRQRLSETAGDVAVHGRYDADPRVSAPAIMTAVIDDLGLDEASATLYLQTLALARPAAAHVRRYNGWSAAEYGAALAPLAARGLLVERKVSAAGRTHFIAEEIVSFPTRSSPIERSKLALYALEPDRRGRIRPPFGMVLPLRPLGAIFRSAWEMRRT